VAYRAKRLRAVGHPVLGFRQRESMKNRPKPDKREGNPSTIPEIAEGGWNFHLNPRDTKGRDRKGSPMRVYGLTRGCPDVRGGEGERGEGGEGRGERGERQGLKYPGKQKLKGAVRTETYWHHYCQHSLAFVTFCLFYNNHSN
jgi:hypothetical protein